MAAISLSHGLLCHFKLNPTTTRSSSRRLLITIASCENRDPFNAKTNKENKEESKGSSIVQKFVEFGKGMKESLSPKQKGDWKDIALMSLSFAVYVYMSQKIVCAYCVWMSMVGQPW